MRQPWGTPTSSIVFAGRTTGGAKGTSKPKKTVRFDDDAVTQLTYNPDEQLTMKK